MDLPVQLEPALQIINKFITLSDTDRPVYADDFNTLKDEIINKLQEKDVVFKRLYNGSSLGGSYADKVKVSKPDEYDLVLRLKLCEWQRVLVTKDENLPGYCRINIKDVLEKIKGEIQNREVYDRLQKFMDENCYLMQNKISSWIEGLMTDIILNDFNNRFEKGNKIYELKYTKAGPAHTLNVTQGDRKMSIDFVPAFVFDKSKWVATRPCPQYIPNTSKDWIAVPKPVKGQQNNLSFITSYVDTERCLIANKYNLKNTLKMLKKMRDRNNITNLKSYFIKTVFLWVNDEQQPEFWNKPTHTVLLHMFEKLLEFIAKKNLPFFWDDSQNMIGNLTDSQILNMQGQLNCILTNLKTRPNKIYAQFLTKEEMHELGKDKSLDFENSNGNVVVACTPIKPKKSKSQRNLALPAGQESKEDQVSEQSPKAILIANETSSMPYTPLGLKTENQESYKESTKPNHETKKTEADKKVEEIKNVLNMHKNDSDKILSEIKKIIDKKCNTTTSDANVLTSMFASFFSRSTPTTSERNVFS